MVKDHGGLKASLYHFYLTDDLKVPMNMKNILKHKNNYFITKRRGDLSNQIITILFYLFICLDWKDVHCLSFVYLSIYLDW